MDPDAGPSLESHRIPPVAWVVALASVGLALAVFLTVPGPVMEGCLHARGCFPVPKAPMLGAVGVLVGGSILSTLLGKIPRHWAIGWNVMLAGMGAIALAVLPLGLVATTGRTIVQLPAWWLGHFEMVFMVVTGSTLLFFALGVLLAGVGIVTSSLLPAHRPLPLPDTMPADPRPRWTQELESVRAAISGSSRPLSSSEAQLVAELAYQVDNEQLDVPPRVAPLGAQLLALLSSEGSHTRMRAVALIERAMASGDDRLQPYRGCGR